MQGPADFTARFLSWSHLDDSEAIKAALSVQCAQPRSSPAAGFPHSFGSPQRSAGAAAFRRAGFPPAAEPSGAPALAPKPVFFFSPFKPGRARGAMPGAGGGRGPLSPCSARLLRAAR